MKTSVQMDKLVYELLTKNKCKVKESQIQQLNEFG